MNDTAPAYVEAVLLEGEMSARYGRREDARARARLKEYIPRILPRTFPEYFFVLGEEEEEEERLGVFLDRLEGSRAKRAIRGSLPTR